MPKKYQKLRIGWQMNFFYTVRSVARVTIQAYKMSDLAAPPALEKCEGKLHP
jgi:hypothetical protein